MAIIRDTFGQYQQTAECGGCATGFWDFFSECLRYYVQAFPSRSPAAVPADVVLESSAGPLLDIQSSPAVKEFYGVELVTIIE